MIIDPLTVAICVVLGFAAFFKSVTGFGFSLCAAPLLMMLLPPEQSVPLLVIVETVIGAWLWFHLSIKWKRGQLVLLVATSVVGMAVGTSLLLKLNADLLRVIVGMCVLLTVVAVWRGLRIPLSSSRTGVGFTGALSGLLGGTTAMSGPPIILFFDAHTQETDEFRGHCIVYFAMTYAIQAAWLTTRSLMTADVFRQAIPGMFVALACLWVSRRWHLRIDSRLFRRLSLGVLAISGGLAAVLGAVRLCGG